MSLETTGRFIKHRRKQLKLTQEKLAEIGNIDQAYIYRLERGKQLGSFDSLINVAFSLNIAPALLAELYADRISLDQAISIAEATGTTFIEAKFPVPFSSEKHKRNIEELEKDAEFLSDAEIIEEIHRLSNIMLQRKKNLNPG